MIPEKNAPFNLWKVHPKTIIEEEGPRVPGGFGFHVTQNGRDAGSLIAVSVALSEMAVREMTLEGYAEWLEQQHKNTVSGSATTPHEKILAAHASDKFHRQQHAIKILRTVGVESFDEDRESVTVAIRAKPVDFLDWDKPLLKQSWEVRTVFRKLHPEYFEGAEPLAASITGRKWMLAWEEQHPGPHADHAQACRLLQRHGLTGIRYALQNERNLHDEPEERFGYLVFDLSKIEIRSESSKKKLDPWDAMAVRIRWFTQTQPALAAMNPKQFQDSVAGRVNAGLDRQALQVKLAEGRKLVEGRAVLPANFHAKRARVHLAGFDFDADFPTPMPAVARARVTQINAEMEELMPMGVSWMNNDVASLGGLNFSIEMRELCEAVREAVAHGKPVNAESAALYLDGKRKVPTALTGGRLPVGYVPAGNGLLAMSPMARRLDGEPAKPESLHVVMAHGFTTWTDDHRGERGNTFLRFCDDVKTAEEQGAKRYPRGKGVEVTLRTNFSVKDCLDLDRPITDQGHRVRQVVERALAAYGQEPAFRPVTDWSPLSVTDEWRAVSGLHFFRRLATVLGSQERAVGWLQAQKVPGTFTELLQGRAAHGREFLVFDPAESLTITHVDGVAVPAKQSLAEGGPSILAPEDMVTVYSLPAEFDAPVNSLTP